MARSSDARERLMAAAKASLIEDGFAGTSARTVAARADAAPGLIYYHFGDLASLLAETSRQVSRQRAEVWGEALGAATTLTEVADIARRLHEFEKSDGNLVMLGQLVAGARTNPDIREAVAANFDRLSAEVEQTFARILTGSPIDGLLDPRVLGRTVSAGFLGIELMDDLTGEHMTLFGELDLLVALVDDVLQAGAIPQAIIRRTLQRRAARLQ